MKKYILAAFFCSVLIFTACGNNADTANDTVDTQVANGADAQTDIQTENKSGIQLETQIDESKESQVEVQSYIQEDNETTSSENEDTTVVGNESENDEETGEQTEMKMNVQVGDYTFTATLENNMAVEEFVDMMKEGPVTISMGDYSGFEKVGSLGRSLTTSNSQTTTDAGDIVLYNGDNIVMFYGSNSWSYTRIGKIDDLTDWNKALGNGSVTAVFTLAE